MEGCFEVFDGFQVGGDVVADRGVGAGAGFDGGDALGRQDGFAPQVFGVLAGVDVVGDDGDGPAVAQGAAERGDGRGLAGADRAAQADAQRAAASVGAERLGAVGVALRHGHGMVEVHEEHSRWEGKVSGGEEPDGPGGVLFTGDVQQR